VLDTSSATAIKDKIQSLNEENSTNFIVDLKSMETMTVAAGEILLDLHHHLYNQGCSLAFVNLQNDVLHEMKKDQFHLSLNLCPTFAEAVDIISMEMLERNILNES